MQWHKVTIDYNGEEILIHDGSSDKSKTRIAGGKITSAINSISTFSFTIYPDNPGYDKLVGLITNIFVTTDEGTLFVGRVLTTSDSMDANGQITKNVLCEDRMGWLCDVVQPYREWDLQYGIRTALQEILSIYNNKAGSAKHITLGQVTVEATNSYHYLSNWETTLETIAEKLIDHYGGELQIRVQGVNTYLDYLDRIGTGTDTTIELAVNMKTITRDIDETSVITRLYPLGAKLDDSENRVQIDYQGHNYIEDANLIALYGVQEGTKIWDDVTESGNLLSKALTYMSTANRRKVQYKISALDLAQAGYTSFQKFKLGNQYQVKNSVMGIDTTLRIIGIVYDMDKPYESSLTFGDKFETISSFTINKSKALQQELTNDNIRSYDFMDSKIANATALITGAEGGYVILDQDTTTGEPYRILIMDTADIDTCTSCIQLNRNGIGFWKASDGGSAATGPYTNAWTIDGNLVASFITANVLTGAKINNGHGTFEVNENGTVVAKSISIQGGSINIQASSETYDVISLSYANSSTTWGGYFSPNQLKFTNSSDHTTVGVQANGIYGKWSTEDKFWIEAASGDIRTFTNGEKEVFHVDTNNQYIMLSDDSEVPFIKIDARNRVMTLYDKISGAMSPFIEFDADNRTFTTYNNYGNEVLKLDSSGTLWLRGGVVVPQYPT